MGLCPSPELPLLGFASPPFPPPVTAKAPNPLVVEAGAIPFDKVPALPPPPPPLALHPSYLPRPGGPAEIHNPWAGVGVGVGVGAGAEAHPTIRLFSPIVVSTPRPAIPWPVNDRLEPSTDGRRRLGVSRSINSGEHLHGTVQTHQTEFDFQAWVTLIDFFPEG